MVKVLIELNESTWKKVKKHAIDKDINASKSAEILLEKGLAVVKK